MLYFLIFFFIIINTRIRNLGVEVICFYRAYHAASSPPIKNCNQRSKFPKMEAEPLTKERVSSTEAVMLGALAPGVNVCILHKSLLYFYIFSIF